MEEVYVDIKGFDGYKISNFGRVLSKKRKKETILKPFMAGNSGKKKGYLRVRLHDGVSFKDFSIHRLVAEAFVPNHDNKLFVNHIDGNKLNTCADNLEWCTASENTLHWYHVICKGEDFGKLLRCYTKDGKFVGEFSSAKQAAEKLNIKRDSSIHRCALGKRKSACGYLWSYENLDLLKPFVDTRNKPIIEYSIFGEKIQEFESIKKAARKHNINFSNISGVCKKKRGYRNVKGKIFRYADDEDNSLIEKYANTVIEATSLRGVCRGTFNGVVDAAKKTGCDFYKIIMCCEGKRKATQKTKFKKISQKQ